LRERKDELEGLADTFLARTAPDKRFSRDAKRVLRAHPYFGNIRELRNVVERAALHAMTPLISPAQITFEQEQPITAASTTLSPADQIEYARITQALERSLGNQTKAAALLGISRRTLVSRLSKFKFLRPRV
jgi:DNA-binding NtrC family response regulator